MPAAAWPSTAISAGYGASCATAGDDAQCGRDGARRGAEPVLTIEVWAISTRAANIDR